MVKGMVFGLILAFLLVSGVYSQSIPDKRVGIIESCVISGNFCGYNLERHLAARVETLLSNSGWVTLARGTKYRDLIEEQNLQGIDPATAPIRNKIWGSTALIKVYAELNISESPQYNSMWINGWGSSGSRTTYAIRGVVNLQTIDSVTGQTKPNVMVEKVLSQTITTNSNLNTPYGSINGSGYTGDVREVLARTILDAIADEAIQKLNQQYNQVPGQRRVEETLIPQTPQIPQNKIGANIQGMGGLGIKNEPEKKSQDDLVIYSTYYELVDVRIGKWKKKIRVKNMSGILRISNIGSGKEVRAIIWNRDKTGITPCVIDLR